MINVTMPDYAFTSWQYTLLMLAFILTTVFVNTWLAPILPALEAVALVAHVAGFLMIIIPLWVLSPKASASDVFLQFSNESGWSMGAAVLLCQVNSLYCILGSDTAVHISEEVADASLVVPRTMWWSYLWNFAIALITLVTMLFCWGPVEDAIAADIPYLVLFTNTGNAGVALMCLIILLLLIYVGNITLLATVSRETWAFARDRGFPFSDWITQVQPRPYAQKLPSLTHLHRWTANGTFPLTASTSPPSSLPFSASSTWAAPSPSTSSCLSPSSLYSAVTPSPSAVSCTGGSGTLIHSHQLVGA